MSDCLDRIGDRGDAGRLSDLRSDGKEGDMRVRRGPQRLGNELSDEVALRRCVGGLAIMLVAGFVPVIASAAECPVRREPNIPAPDGSIAKDFNIDTYKRQLTEYQKKGYNSDIVAVMEKATRYVLDRALERAGEVKRPAVVLDIDETSLSNWDNIKADDYGFIEGGACPLQAKMACGFNDWIDMAIAPAIEPTLKFFNAIRAKEDAVSRKEIPNIAVFFVTGRREQQRRATLWNLDRAGFKGWTGIATRPDAAPRTILPLNTHNHT